MGLASAPHGKVGVREHGFISTNTALNSCVHYTTVLNEEEDEVNNRVQMGSLTILIMDTMSHASIDTMAMSIIGEDTSL